MTSLPGAGDGRRLPGRRAPGAAGSARAFPRLSARARLPLLLVLSLLVLAAPGSRLAAQGTRPEILSVSFDGNETFSDDALQSAIESRPTECRSWVFQALLLCPLDVDFAEDQHYLNSRSLARDQVRLEVYYYQRGFRQAQVDTLLERADEGVRVTFRIDEGRPVIVDSLRITGVGEVDPEVVERLPLEEGGRLSGPQLDATRDTLLRRLERRGYAHADILRSFFIPRENPLSARVEYDVDPGTRARFGPLEVVGNRQVSDRVVQRMLPFQQGTRYNPELIFSGQRNLFNLHIFRHADITPVLDHQPDSIVPVRIQVNEGDVHRVRVGAGWSTAECLATEARWTSRNFFGGARRLQVHGRVNNVLAQGVPRACPQAGDSIYAQLAGQFGVDFNQPWIFSSRNSFAASLYAERQTLPDIFVRQALGANLALVRSVGRNTPLTFSYRPQIGTLDAAELFFCSNFLVCVPSEIDVLQGANWISPLGVNITRDLTNSLLNPTRGYSAALDLEYADGWTGSDFRYVRGVGEVSWYQEVTSGWVVATRLRGGWISPRAFEELQGSVEGIDLGIVPPQKRFYAGGANSVRGFAQNRLGPRVLTIAVDSLLAPWHEDDGTLRPGVCTPEQVLSLTCDPSPLPKDTRFSPQPTGGRSLVEGNVEVRFQVSPSVEGATFLDFGQVFAEADGTNLGALEFTPGLGIRYLTPIGPLRVDLGYKFRGAERLPVVTSQIRPYDPDIDPPIDGPRDPRLVGPTGERIPFVRSEELALLMPRVLYGARGGPWDAGRFQLHFSIGQAF